MLDGEFTAIVVRVDYTPAVIVSPAVTENLTKASWIRRVRWCH